MCGWGYMSRKHAHQSPDGPGILPSLPPVLPAQGGFPTTHIIIILFTDPQSPSHSPLDWTPFTPSFPPLFPPYFILCIASAFERRKG